MSDAGQRVPCVQLARPGLQQTPCRLSLILCCWAPPHLTGAPATNTTFFCSATTTSCYQYFSAAASYAAQRSKCQALGGGMASYNSPAEQLEVEVYFSTMTSVMTARSLPSRRSFWYLSDGTLLGGGYPNNGDGSGQYAHWCAAPPSATLDLPWRLAADLPLSHFRCRAALAGYTTH